MQVYIAAPFFNQGQLECVKVIEQLLDDSGISYFSPRAEGVLTQMTEAERVENMKAIFNSNIKNIKECPVMIAVTEGESGARDTGTVFEVGYASCLRDFEIMEYGKTPKTVITFCRAKGKSSVMLSETADAHIDGFITLKAFLKHAAIRGFPSAIRIANSYQEKTGNVE